MSRISLKNGKRFADAFLVVLLLTIADSVTSEAYAGGFPVVSTADGPCQATGWANLVGPQMGPPFLDIMMVKPNWAWVGLKFDFTCPPDGIADSLVVCGVHRVGPHGETVPNFVLGGGTPYVDVVPPACPGAFPIVAPLNCVRHGEHMDCLQVRFDLVPVGGVMVRRMSIQLDHLDEGQEPRTLVGPLGPVDDCPPETVCDDCNGNGISDAEDIDDGTSRDCNSNGVPDECESDCNGNGVPDDCEVLEDCNNNGVPDLCDIAFGLSKDRNDNGIPDECECPWDLDDNGSVGAADLLALLVSWGPCKGCPADFDGDGNVGASDLLALLANWGPCP